MKLLYLSIFKICNKYCIYYIFYLFYFNKLRALAQYIHRHIYGNNNNTLKKKITLNYNSNNIVTINLIKTK